MALGKDHAEFNSRYKRLSFTQRMKYNNFILLNKRVMLTIVAGLIGLAIVTTLITNSIGKHAYTKFWFMVFAYTWLVLIVKLSHLIIPAAEMNGYLAEAEGGDSPQQDGPKAGPN